MAGYPRPLPVANNKAKLHKWCPVIHEEKLRFAGRPDDTTFNDPSHLLVSEYVVNRARTRDGRKKNKVFVDSMGNEITLVGLSNGVHSGLILNHPSVLYWYEKGLSDHWQHDLNKLNDEARARRAPPPPQPPPPPPPAPQVLIVEERRSRTKKKRNRCSPIPMKMKKQKKTDKQRDKEEIDPALAIGWMEEENGGDDIEEMDEEVMEVDRGDVQQNDVVLVDDIVDDVVDPEEEVEEYPNGSSLPDDQRLPIYDQNDKEDFDE
ncbi:hypothetical protein PRIPAC_77023 [Pristionchus pacificus]|uniref:Uncharacterized protein n=1 Tax=Pristionchus pacificus TaxID=54126 RepID=A0A454Y3G4_PRIPA|nr:hypothetical protein PRIPAC_77023 [Pristionchus pacificus]|eukprot:PDM72346.1 hypothetical protein PRIPAC_38780 [Pristionchus pacificus]